MKQSNQKQAAAKGVNRWRKAGSRTLPMLGAAILFGMATPALADTKVSFHVGHSNAHQKVHPGRVVERKLNRVARKVSREINALQPVSHRDRVRRDRGHNIERSRHNRYDRHVRRDHRRADRYRDYRQQRRRHYYADPLRADPLYQPMSYRRWSRYQKRLTHDWRYVNPGVYQRYLKKYRKHYRHGHEQPYFAGIDRHGRGHKRNRH